ncbi:DUF1090 family protein [Xenorhabdus szentirmaii]|uniref:DUF1090 family protein n=1 Tax=Xenorhabdus szentirmaii TaxID=290112 RepID=UPI0019C81AD4|nr:DUF1090 family protein [Xenorhabdus sp. 38]MBD2782734.1 DUF1090 family protein [Xenorhabdus sp. 38]
MMSKTVLLSVLTVFSMSVAYANQDNSGCEIKRKTLEKQLEYAKADKDNHMVAGLTRTLKTIKILCYPEKHWQTQINNTEMVKHDLAASAPPKKKKKNKKTNRQRRFTVPKQPTKKRTPE